MRNSPPVDVVSCNDGTNDCFQDSRRLLRLGVQTLARDLLSGRPAAEALVRALRRGVQYGRDQRQLLPPAARIDVRQMARSGASRLPLCGQGEPVPDPHEEAQGCRGFARYVSRSRRTAQVDAWTDPLPATAEPA